MKNVLLAKFVNLILFLPKSYICLILVFSFILACFLHRKSTYNIYLHKNIMFFKSVQRTFEVNNFRICLFCIYFWLNSFRRLRLWHLSLKQFFKQFLFTETSRDVNDGKNLQLMSEKSLKKLQNNESEETL